LAEEVVKELILAQGIEDAALVQRLARLSGGSPGQALALADPRVWEFRRSLLEGLARPDCDSVALAQSWIRFVEEAGKEAAAQRRRAALVLRFLIQFLNAALTLIVGGTPNVMDPADLPILEQFAHHLDADELLDILDRCLESAWQIDRRVQLVLVLEALLDALGRKLTVQK
jgi:DNA polymerase-3 subunit delta'